MTKLRTLSILFIIFFCGCVTIYNPATEKQEFLLFDTESEVALGRNLSQQVEVEYKILEDSPLNKRLQKIGKKVSGASDRTDLEYQFFLIDDDQLNAFAIPGGFIYVNKAVLEKADDDELACILGHEIGHIAARHNIKKLQTMLGYQILIQVALGKSSADLISSMDIIYNIISLGYSREDERLADRLGIKYAWKANYNPEGMVSFFYKLKSESEKLGPHFNLVFLSSHPPVEERIKNVQQEIELLKKKEADIKNN